MRFEIALNGYWLDKKRDFSDATIRDYELTFARFAEFVGPHHPLEEITSDRVRAFLNSLRNERALAPKTVCNAWTALSSFWTWAEMELQTPHVIRGRIKAPKVPRPQIVPYTEVEVKALLAACDHASGVQKAARPTALRDRAIIVTLVDTGVRVSELCAFRIENYTSSRGQLMVLKGKSSKARTVFLGKAGQRALWRYLADRPDASSAEPLFATRSNLHMDRHGVRHMIQGAAKRAGVQNATVHRFRHTFAINFLRNGGNPLELQQLLGHEKMDTLQIYVTLARADLEQAQQVASPGDRWRL